MVLPFFILKKIVQNIVYSSYEVQSYPEVLLESDTPFGLIWWKKKAVFIVHYFIKAASNTIYYIIIQNDEPTCSSPISKEEQK